MSVARLLKADGIKKHFPATSSLFSWLDKTVVRAVDGVSFELSSGETLSIVGESGCGKTTIARLLLGLEQPTEGSILFRGKDIEGMAKHEWREFRLSVQAVFQDPTSSLDPKHRVGATIAEPLIVNTDIRGTKLKARVHELLRSVGLDASTADSFPHELSGGMRQRVSIARALALNPKLIVLDEPVSALDVSIRAQIMNLLKDLQDEYGIAYIMIAHDLGTVRYLSHKVAAMYVGQIVEAGGCEDVLTHPLHPYTVALISAAGTADELEESRIILAGEIASPIDPPPGCRFHPRCWLARQLGTSARCSSEQPVARMLLPGHQVACHFAEELATPDRRTAHLVAARSESTAE